MKSLSRLSALTLLTMATLPPHILLAENEDESKVPAYTLPDPLVTEDGKPVKDVETWQNERRPELVRLFEEQVYGKAPGKPDELRFEELKPEVDAFGGKAKRKEVRVFFGKADSPTMDLLIYRPADAPGKVPVFMGLNFGGNHTVEADPEITLPESWMRPKPGIVKNRATEKTRGASASRWPVELVVGRGYGLVTAYCGDIDPDFDDGFQNGVHRLSFGKGKRKREPGDWGTVAAWAWGLSRALDYLEADPDFDAEKVAVLGHSRLGKTSLWAGARDERFAVTISNDSGCGGAALHRREFGETVARINRSFPHWFCGNFHQYGEDVSKIPVDQHQLVALVAPRPVYIASASLDLWADPKGEFLSAKGAEPVYRLFGHDGLPAAELPTPNTPIVGGHMGHHVREGKHDITAYDWERYLDFADRFLK